MHTNELAEFMHNEYEAYAKLKNWKTQKECQVEFEKLPEANRQVMLYVARQVKRRFKKEFKICRDNLLSRLSRGLDDASISTKKDIERAFDIGFRKMFQLRAKK